MVKKKRRAQHLIVIWASLRSPGTPQLSFGSVRVRVSPQCVTVWLSVYWDVDGGLILGKSGEAAKAKSYFKASPARPAPHTPLKPSQAAVARGLGQPWRVLFREQREVLAPEHSHPMNYFNARLDLQARSKVIIGPN